jgi:hypothetical protein
MGALYRRDAEPRAVAALAAASTCCTAYMDAPAEEFDLVCVRAIDADALARRTPVTWHIRLVPCTPTDSGTVFAKLCNRLVDAV